MAALKPIPIGIEDFKELIDKNYYFVDKTLMIKDLIDNCSKVSLFTRPRRFGKTLNLSMIQRYFEKTDEDNSYLFDRLKISGAGEKYKAYQGQFPVISLSLKSMKQADYELAYETYKDIIKDEFQRHKKYVYQSDVLDNEELKRYESFLDIDANDSAYNKAIGFLSKCLKKVYQKNVIILIDEYDVPLECAYFGGFYDKMVNLIRSAFESALKTNPSLEFAVMTGCLRISKESIFTGLNNLNVYSVINNKFSEYFGFTENEVHEIAEAYGFENRIAEMKSWYDGYLFGNTEIYNPWSVLKYLSSAAAGEHISCRPYWINTSSNSIIHQLIRESNPETKKKIEILMQGGSVTAPIYEDSVYANIDVNAEDIWSFLLFTGYLKQIHTELSDSDETIATMVIPNREIMASYRRIISVWFNEKIKKEGTSDILQALLDEKPNVLESILNDWLFKSISYHDENETFYHGFLMGLLVGFDKFEVKSNRENGDGRTDITICKFQTREIAVVIEIKVAENFRELDLKCDEALKQIEEKKYAEQLMDDCYQKVVKYGVAFYKKACKVKTAK